MHEEHGGDNVTGDEIQDGRERGWFWDTNDIFDAGLSHYALVVRLYLARCADNTPNRKSFPSAKNIAEKCGISRRKVFDALEELCNKGWLDKIPRQKTGKTDDKVSRDSNLYILTTPTGSAPPTPPTSAPEELVQGVHHPKAGDLGGVVHEVHQGSAQDALGVVHEVHSEQDPLEQDSFNKTYLQTTGNSKDEAGSDEGAPGSVRWSDVMKAYHASIGIIGPTQDRKVREWHEVFRMDYAVIIAALEQTKEDMQARKVRGSPFSYFEGILRNWHNDGIRSPDDLKEHRGPQTMEESIDYIRQVAATMEGWDD